MSNGNKTFSPDGRQPSAAQSAHFTPAASALPEAAKQAIAAYNSGDWAKAEQLCRLVLSAKPDYFGALNILGAITAQTKRLEEAAHLLGCAVAAQPGNAAAHNNYGNALQELRQLDAAIASYDRAIAIRPDYAEAYNNRGAALQALRQPDAAIASYDRAIAIRPDYAEAYGNRGNALRELKQLDAAIASYDRAIAIKSDDADTYYNRGIALAELNRLDAAIASYDRAIAIRADYADAYYSRGVALQGLRQLDDSIVSYNRAIDINPAFAAAHIGLGSALKFRGRLSEAETSYRKALAIDPNSAAAKTGYAECISAMQFHDFDDFIHATTARALSEAWIRPLNLSRIACNLLRMGLRKSNLLKPKISFDHQTLSEAECVELDALTLLNDDALLHSLLSATPIVDAELEDFLTLARRSCLNEAANTNGIDNKSLPRLHFYCSLAKQCFINEYVFSYFKAEIQSASNLSHLLIASLENNSPVSALLVVAVACYFPLHSLAKSEKLLEYTWPDEVRSLLTMQIQEPLEELQLRRTIPQLTAVEGEVSLAVQNQYEENPYPRWIKIPQSKLKQPIDAYFRDWFPFAEIREFENIRQPEILIAGCGTGQHSIDTAQSLQGAKILAIDLSMSSLSYAKRKTLELNIDAIEYAQADLLKLDKLGRTFDVIEASGVLHHLADPLEGWRMLLSILRPNGFMKLGLYSEIARRDIVKARSLVSSRGYGSTPPEIRECRQYLRQIEKAENLGSVLQGDFFSTSNCRDWLFHVEEHRMTLDAIAGFLKANNLSFLGFQFDSAVLHSYGLRFPDDRAGTNLDHWKIFERENPDTFGGMYQFWIQKK